MRCSGQTKQCSAAPVKLLVTSMDRDGTTAGYDVDLLRAISDRISVPLVASGGAGKMEHLRDAIILGHADAVLAASIFHYHRISISELKSFSKLIIFRCEGDRQIEL